MGVADVNPEIWALVFEAVTTRRDLLNVCNVCRSFNAVATPFLYRFIIFRGSNSKNRSHWLSLPDDDDDDDDDDEEEEEKKKEEKDKKIEQDVAKAVANKNLSSGLLCRLLDDRNEALQRAVHEITILDRKNDKKTVARVWRKLQPPRDLLAALVRKLPNLKAICFYSEVPVISDGLVDALVRHQNSPKLHLLAEAGRTRVDIPMPFVQRLRTSVNAHDVFPVYRADEATDKSETEAEPDPQGRETKWPVSAARLVARSYHHASARSWEQQRLALHELFQAFPNLEELSVSVNHLQGGCTISEPRSPTQIVGLDLPDGATFPPIKSLSLSGYPVDAAELSSPVWRDRFAWDKLETLRLGVQVQPFTAEFLQLATGKTINLKEFQITSYADYHLPSASVVLDAFLSSLDGTKLESLTARGSVPSFSSVFRQSNIRHLCLHMVEDPQTERRTLDAAQIKILDSHCPKLTSLEIDLDPKGEDWPEDILNALATSFKNLRRLSLHIGLDLYRVECHPPAAMEPAFARVLTRSKALDFGKRFFQLRDTATATATGPATGPATGTGTGTEPKPWRRRSVLEKLTLRTGESLRWYPQWFPEFANAEEQCAKIFELYPPPPPPPPPPSSPSPSPLPLPRIRELESKSARQRRLLELRLRKF